MGSLKQVLTSFLWVSVVFLAETPCVFSAKVPTPIPSETPKVEKTEFTQNFEKDFIIKSLNPVRISNLRGNLTIKGWVLDRIRVKAVKKTLSENQATADAEFQTADLRFNQLGKEFELSADYGKGLDIESRVRERAEPKVKMDLEVFVPSKMAVSAFTYLGDIRVDHLENSLEVRTSSGAIHVSRVRAKNVFLICPTCEIHAQGVNSDLRVMGGEGTIELTQVKSKSVYVESSSGFIRAEDMSGSQMYVSKSGAVFGDQLRGKIEFNTGQGSVQLSQVNGFVSGKTHSGNVSVKILKWEFLEKAFIETEVGAIRLELPFLFSGEVDFWSPQRELSVHLPIRAIRKTSDPLGKNSTFVGPLPASEQNRVRGFVGSNRLKEHETLQIFSAQGSVEVLRTQSNPFGLGF